MTARIASAIASTSSGSTSGAASPSTSGNDVEVLATTGVPQAIASSGGSPNPSQSEGYAQTDAAE